MCTKWDSVEDHVFQVVVNKKLIKKFQKRLVISAASDDATVGLFLEQYPNSAYFLPFLKMCCVVTMDWFFSYKIKQSYLYSALVVFKQGLMISF